MRQNLQIKIIQIPTSILWIRAHSFLINFQKVSCWSLSNSLIQDLEKG